MNIGSIAITQYLIVSPHDSIASVEQELLRDGVLVLFNGDEFVGLLTAEDTIQNPRLLVVDCMTEKPRIDYEQSLAEVLALMDRESHQFLPVFRDGSFYGVTSYRTIACSLRDERDRMRRLEQEHLAKIAQFDAMRTLAGGVAHDLNNYLASIVGMVELATMDPGIHQENARRLRDAANAVNNACQLAHQLMTFSRHGALVKEKTDIVKFVEENARFVIRGMPLELCLSFDGKLGEVEISREQFARVIHNLVLNTAQAVSKTGGTLFIEGKTRLIGETGGLPLPAGRYLQLVFRDNGPGIDPSILPHIFEPYFTTKREGNGLGLAIVYSIVTDHDGYVEVDSTPAGTTFYLYFPVKFPSDE